MHKKLHRVSALLMALVLLMTCSAAAFADEADASVSSAMQESTGIIDAAYLENWVQEYIQNNNLGNSYQELSIGFVYTGTGDRWYYNADVWMYSASLYKVPVTMLMAQKEAAGEISQDTSIYGTQLSYLEETALTYSNNDSGHIMINYLGGDYSGKCSDMAIGLTSLPESYFSDDDFFSNSYYSARFITEVMSTLYFHRENFPNVVECLLNAQPGEYFKRTLSQYDVAQKYGAYEEPNGTQNNHCTAIIYTDTPIIVTVMTKNIGDYQSRISEIGQFFAEYSAQLDTIAAEQAAATPAPTAAAEPAATETAGDSGSSAVQTGETTAAAPASGTQTAETGSAVKLAAVLFIVLLIVLLVVVVILVGRSRRRRRRRRKPVPQRRRPQPEEWGDEDDEPAPRPVRQERPHREAEPQRRRPAQEKRPVREERPQRRPASKQSSRSGGAHYEGKHSKH